MKPFAHTLNDLLSKHNTTMTYEKFKEVKKNVKQNGNLSVTLREREQELTERIVV